MTEWFDAKTSKPLPDNTHGDIHVVTYWPLHALDDNGDMTEKIVGGHQHIVTYTSVGNGGHFDEPTQAEACGDWFGDDYCYALGPSHWARCIDNPDGSKVDGRITAIDCLPVSSDNAGALK